MNTSMAPASAGRRSRWLLGSLIGVVALVGAACGSDDGNGDGDGDGGETAAGLDGRGYADGHRLVSGDWLEENLESDDLVIVDLRDAEDFVAGHIPGARQIPEDLSLSRTDENGVSGQIATQEDTAAVLGALGVSPDSTVVLYDGRSSLQSARSLWVFDVYGHGETRILDGSWTLWESEGRPTSSEVATFETTDYVFNSEPNSGIIANFEEMAAAISDPEALICDARSAEEFAGRDIRADQGGHVPGAGNVEWTQAVNDESQFKTAEELRTLYEGQVLTGDDDKTIYVYCQTGVRAAHTWFVFHDLLGLDSVKNYDGSWVEYGNRTDSDIERS